MMTFIKPNRVAIFCFSISAIISVSVGQSSTSAATPQAVDPKFQCNFDLDWCGFTQDTADDSFDWDKASGRLPHADTGPQFGDHTSGSGMYAFINASTPRKDADMARLISPTLRFTTHCATLTFFYYALGLNLGSLTVRTGFPDALRPYSNWSLVFQIKGPEQIKSWRRYQTTMLTEATFQVVFEAKVGNGYQGAYSIDDIEVQSVACPTNLKLDKPPSPGWAILYNTSNDDGTSTQPPPNGWGRGLPVGSGLQKATTKAPSQNTGEDLPQWAIALLVIGCIFITAAVLFLVIRYIRKQKKDGSKYKAQHGAGQSRSGISMTAESGTSSAPGTSKHAALGSESSFELPSTSKQTINVPIEGKKSVRFQGDYETEYGFGLKMSNGLPTSLTPVPKELLKEAERNERRAARRSKYTRSKLTVRQRRKLRVAAKLAAKAEKQRLKELAKGGAGGAPATFSLLPQNGDKFGNEPGKKRPIPLPPPHILDMLMKMRSPNNLQAKMAARARANGGAAGTSRMTASALSPSSDGPNSVIAVVEPERFVPRQAIHRDDLGVEDVDDDEFDDEFDDDGTMDAENGSDRESNASEIDEIVAEWERTQLAELDRSPRSKSSLPPLTTSGGIIVAQNSQRNKVTVISSQSQPPLPPVLPSSSYYNNPQRSDFNNAMPSSTSFNAPYQAPMSTRPNTTPVQVVSHPSPGGLYDGLDDDDDDD